MNLEIDGLPMIESNGGDTLRERMYNEQWIVGETGFDTPEKFILLAKVAGDGDIYFEKVVSRVESGTTTYKATFVATMTGWMSIVSYMEAMNTKGPGAN
jgi:hypothetical protein